MTGTHLLTVAAAAYHAPPVVSFRRLQMLLSDLQDPAGSATLPPLNLKNASALK